MKRLKGFITSSGSFIWLGIALLAGFYLLKWIPFNWQETVTSSPAGFILPSLLYIEGISHMEYNLPIGAIALVVVFIVFMKR